MSLRKCEACSKETDNLRSVDLGLLGLKVGLLPVGVKEKIVPFVRGTHNFCFDCHQEMWMIAANTVSLDEKAD